MTGVACDSLFDAAEAADLDARFGVHHLTASVYDERSGCTYDLAPYRRNTTASVFKIAMMARVLLAAQDAGRGLTAGEDALIWPMITRSDDAAAGTLFTQFGGAAAMNDFSVRIGMWETFTPGPTWGLTSTSARDQVALLRLLVGDAPGIFSAYSRAAAQHYLESVIPEQSWGVRAGLPAGWSAVQKNGFYPASCCAWRINTAGRVSSPSGPGYVTVVLTDGWSTEAEGIGAVEEVTRLVNAHLAHDDSPGARPGGGPVTVNADGRLEAFGASPTGVLANAFQYQIGLGWSPWYPHGGDWAGGQQPSAVLAIDQRLELFALRHDGHVVHTMQLPIGQGWSAQIDLGSGFAWGPVTARNLDGRLEIFAVGTDGVLRHRWQGSPDGPWDNWQGLMSDVGGPPAVGTAADGRLVVAAVSTAGVLRAVAQVAPNSAWGPIVTIGTGTLGRPALGRNADGRLEVAVRDTGGQAVHSWQVGFGWSTLESFGPTLYDQPPTLASNADGRLELFGVDRTGRLTHQWQLHPNSGWGAAYSMGEQLAGPPTVATNTDTRLEVFAVGIDRTLWHAYQYGPNSAWSPLSTLGGSLTPG